MCSIPLNPTKLIFHAFMASSPKLLLLICSWWIMSEYHRNLLFIVIAAALIAGCSDPPKACICAGDTITTSNDMPNHPNTNILASLIQISQLASQNQVTHTPQPASVPDVLTAQTQDPAPLPEEINQPEPTVVADLSEPSQDDAIPNPTEIAPTEPSQVPTPPVDMLQIASVSARSTTIGHAQKFTSSARRLLDRRQTRPRTTQSPPRQ